MKIKVWFSQSVGVAEITHLPFHLFLVERAAIAQLHRNILRTTVARNCQRDIPARRSFAHQPPELNRTFHYLAVIPRNHIMFLQTGFGRRTIRLNVDHLNAARSRKPQVLGLLSSDLSDFHSKPAAAVVRRSSENPRLLPPNLSSFLLRLCREIRGA